MLVAAIVGVFSIAPAAQGTLSVEHRAAVDRAVTELLSSISVPSASIAIVRDGAIVYERAYGSGRLAPARPATPSMRYSIGSNSKQFTAAAILLLAEDGKLSVDEKVAKWFPQLTRAEAVSVRQLLSMTAGYQDYWPQDYLFAEMTKPITPQEIVDRWARKPLDFDPGTDWQYSNTNYMIAGLIAEKASGMSLFDFMHKRIFGPLQMVSVTNSDLAPLGDSDAGGYLRNALGPLKPAPKEATGWLYAAGHLAMTAHDLALWDISLINRSLLRPDSYRAMQSDMVLNNGFGSQYGLGLVLDRINGRRRISHGGAAYGYVTMNDIYPDDRTAIVVLTNSTGSHWQIVERIASIIFSVSDTAASAALAQAKRIFADFQRGRIDRKLFSDNANTYFSADVVKDYASSLAPLGNATEFVQVSQESRGGMLFRAFRVVAGGKALRLTTRALPDGTLEQYLVSPSS